MLRAKKLQGHPYSLVRANPSIGSIIVSASPSSPLFLFRFNPFLNIFSFVSKSQFVPVWSECVCKWFFCRRPVFRPFDSSPTPIVCNFITFYALVINLRNKILFNLLQLELIPIEMLSLSMSLLLLLYWLSVIVVTSVQKSVVLSSVPVDRIKWFLFSSISRNW